MNKSEFIQELSRKLNRSISDCTLINDVLEENFFISKKSMTKIVAELVSRLDIDADEATQIYDTAKDILKNEIKNKLKHPFRTKD